MPYDYAVERALRQQKLRRKARRGEIALRRLYKFIRFLIILFIFYSVFRTLNCHYWYLSSDIYTKKGTPRIEVLGNNIVSKDKIINQMKKIPMENKPIYMINPEKMTKEIEKLSPVKRAYIRRFWFPARLVVMIDEVIPAITISPSEEAPAVAAFGHNGELINREYLPLKNNFPTANILSYGTNGDDYEKWDKEKISDLYKLYKLIEDYSGEKVKYIDLRTPHNTFVQLESIKIKLGEIDASVFERIKQISTLIPEVKKLKEPIKYVDLSWHDSTYLKMEEY